MSSMCDWKSLEYGHLDLYNTTTCWQVNMKGKKKSHKALPLDEEL